jgi:hypothetical protein
VRLNRAEDESVLRRNAYQNHIEKEFWLVQIAPTNNEAM